MNNTSNNTSNVGVIAYLSFKDALCLKQCSKLFCNINLPNNLIFALETMNEQSEMILLKYGKHINKLIMSFEIYKKSIINNISSVCLNINKLVLTNVNIINRLSDDAQCFDELYLKSNIFNNK